MSRTSAERCSIAYGEEFENVRRPTPEERTLRVQDDASGVQLWAGFAGGAEFGASGSQVPAAFER
jgi:hypothetical protein